MSVIVKTKEEITKSPLNTSISKSMYTFPKTMRFQDLKKGRYDINYKNISMANTLYQLPDVKSKRATSIGYGTKYDFTKEQKNKAPYYNMKSDFGKDHPLPSYTFGIAREHYEKVGFYYLY